LLTSLIPTISATRPAWPENVLRQRPCSESRSRKNGSSGKPEKRQNSQNRKGWRKNFGENRKKRKFGREKNNARGIWHTA